MKFLPMLAGTACALALLAAPTSSADVYLPTNGGMSCQGTSGFGAHSFYFANTYAENVDTSTQYLTCELPTINAGTPSAPSNVYVIFVNTKGAQINFTCAIQAGYDHGVGVVNTAVYNVAVPANQYTQLTANPSSTPALPTANNTFGSFSMSCAVPPGGRIGMISSVVPGTL